LEPNKGWIPGWGKAVFTEEYSYTNLKRFLRKVVDRAEGDDLEQVIWRIAQHLSWEDEDYQGSKHLRCTLEKLELDHSRRRFWDDDPEAFLVPVAVWLTGNKRTYELETIVQSPGWLARTLDPGELHDGTGSVFIFDYEESMIEAAIAREVEGMGAQTEGELVARISRLGKIKQTTHVG
jgi:hypothetical protein